MATILAAGDLFRASQQRFATPQVDVFATPGAATYTKPAGLKWVRVIVQAAGGAGGGAAGGGGIACGGSGGSGGYAESIYAADELPDTVAVTVGAAGAPATGAAGGNGGTSSFGALMTCGGGTGGSSGASSTAATTAGAGSGGSASGGNVLNRPGANGVVGRTLATSVQTFMQRGADSLLGTGGNTSLSDGGNGTAGSGYGAGGGNAIASSTARAGGAGAPGVVIVENHF